MNDYLQTLTDKELVDYMEWFTADDEPGFVVTAAACNTPHGLVTQKMVEREIERRMGQ